MATVAILGMGLLGAGFAHKLIDEGHAVRVWNRTAGKCSPLAERGAVACNTPAETLQGAERVHLVLSEDDAVESVLEQLLPDLPEGLPIVDHSTNAPAKVRDRVERLHARGVRYLHAPVFMAPANARAATGAMLVSGPADLVDAVLPALETMTGRVVQLGADPSRAATVKLTGNAMLIVITAGMGDVFRLGEANGMSAEQCLDLFGWFSPTARSMGERALRDGPASFELSMARKDVRLMLEASGDAPLTVLPGIADRMDEALEVGRGTEDFARFVRSV